MKQLTPEERKQLGEMALRPHRPLLKLSGLPPLVKAPWEMLRSAVEIHKKVRADIRNTVSEMWKKDELRPAVREQRENELMKKGFDLIAAGTQRTRELAVESQAAIDRELERAGSLPDPLALPRVNADKLMGSDEELAKLIRGGAAVSATTARLLARQDVDRRIDRVLERNAGNPVKTNEGLVSMYRAALADGDALIVGEIERHGLPRLQREYPEAMSVLLKDEVTQTCASRVPDTMRSLPAHKAELDNCLLHLRGLESEASKPDFWNPQGRAKDYADIIRETLPELWEG